MSNEVQKSVNIMKVINRHLEETNCHHNIKAIMREALENESKRSVDLQQTVDQTTKFQIPITFRDDKTDLD